MPGGKNDCKVVLDRSLKHVCIFLIVRVWLSRRCSWDFWQTLRVPNVFITSWTPSFFRPDLQRKVFWFSYENRVQKYTIHMLHGFYQQNTFQFSKAELRFVPSQRRSQPFDSFDSKLAWIRKHQLVSNWATSEQKGLNCGLPCVDRRGCYHSSPRHCRRFTVTWYSSLPVHSLAHFCWSKPDQQRPAIEVVWSFWHVSSN